MLEKPEEMGIEHVII